MSNDSQVWLVADLKTKIMIEKIDEIRDLLIVPSVDEQPKMAINQMKILNLLVELRAEAEQLTIPSVVGRSEQLPLNPITDKEHKKLMKALYHKDNSKRFRR